MERRGFGALVTTVTLAAACSEGASNIDATTSMLSNLPCEVQSIIATKCAQCHDRDPKAGAPMSLATQSDWLKTRGGRAVKDLALGRINDRGRPMPPGASPQLSADEKAALEKWLGDGSPAGACGAPEITPTNGGAPPPCQADQVLKATRPYAMGMKDDQYVCFGVDIENATKRHVWAMYPQVDNPKITHHILVFTSDKAVDPNPHECDSNGASDWKVVGGWAPGGGPILFPAEAGFPEKTGTTHWVVQLHYNNTGRAAAMTDQSSFGLCTTDQLRKHDAGLITFGALSFTIPPRKRHGITCDFKLDDRFKNAHFFGGAPHMHQLGKAMYMNKIAGAGDAKTPIINATSFDFNEQGGLPLSVDVTAGDRIQTRCEWENTTDKAVRFGEGTGAEMCLGFISYYPAIEDQYTQVSGQQVPVFNWTTPSNNLPIMDLLRQETGIAIPAPSCRED